MPPVGTVCEVFNHTFGKNAEWEKCNILWRGEFLTVYSSESHQECSASNEHLEFRPVIEKTHREKVIEAAVMVCTGVNIPTSTDGLTMKTLNKLYNAGMLVLPQDSSDTED